MTGHIRTLAILERLRRHEMASDARELAAQRVHVAELLRARASLLERLKNEARIITLEAAPYVGAYIRAIRNEVARIDRALAKATPRLDALEAVMAERFREKETITLALNRAQDEQKHERSRREALESDALTLIRRGARLTRSIVSNRGDQRSKAGSAQ